MTRVHFEISKKISIDSVKASMLQNDFSHLHAFYRESYHVIGEKKKY